MIPIYCGWRGTTWIYMLTSCTTSGWSWSLESVTSYFYLYSCRSVMALNYDTKATGHWGREKTLRQLQRSFYCIGMSRDVDLYVCTCRERTLNMTKLMPQATNFQAGKPNERVYLDFLRPLEGQPPAELIRAVNCGPFHPLGRGIHHTRSDCGVDCQVVLRWED